MKSSNSAAGARVSWRYALSAATATMRVLKGAAAATAFWKLAAGNGAGSTDSGACITADGGASGPAPTSCAGKGGCRLQHYNLASSQADKQYTGDKNEAPLQVLSTRACNNIATGMR